MTRRAVVRWAVAALLLAPAALAHDLARDHRVGALMHLAPDDDPKAGEVTEAFFALGELGGAPITLAQCACTLDVLRGSPDGAALPAARLRDDHGHLSAQLTFPTPGAYTLRLRGAPRAGATFAPFTLSWTVRAEPR